MPLAPSLRGGKITRTAVTDDPEMFMAATDQWYWCFEHQRAEHEGDQCRAADRLGPFPTEDAARNWRATNEAREASWKQEDDEWEGDGPRPT